MMIKQMTVLAFALGFVTLAAADYTDLTWYKDPIQQVMVVPDGLSAVQVSPTGNQIAMYYDSCGLELRKLKAQGRVGASVFGVMDLDFVSSVAFSADGNWVFAPAATKVVMYKRANSEIWVTDLPGFVNTAGVTTISQRPEFYVQSLFDVSFAAFDLASRQLLETCGQRTATEWGGFGIAASPDGERIHTLWQTGALPKRCMTAAFSNPRTGRELLWRQPIDLSYAMCIGPDPDHYMLATSSIEGGVPHLIVIRGADGHVVDHYDIAVGPGPMAMAASQDGRYVVTTNLPDSCLVTISGADIRGLMDPNFEIAEADVRTHTVALDEWPRGVALHPTLNIAYVWSENKLYVIRIGLPGV